MTAAVVVCGVSLAASLLTLFSGFGLGTLLTPAFCLFFPVEAAVAMTAVVHFANNLFKLALLGRHADRGVLMRFGVPSIPAAIAGAWLLKSLAAAAPMITYEFLGRACTITPAKLAIGLLMAGFALAEAAGGESRGLDPRWLPLGGALSGFLGGLSGHQGALRGAFLLRSGLSKEAFLGTGVAIACLVDLSRLSVYGGAAWERAWGERRLVAAAVSCAFLGAWLGSRLLAKTTLRGVQLAVTAMLLLIGTVLAAGIL